jgi:hypothetical protein
MFVTGVKLNQDFNILISSILLVKNFPELMADDLSWVLGSK